MKLTAWMLSLSVGLIIGCNEPEMYPDDDIDTVPTPESSMTTEGEFETNYTPAYEADPADPDPLIPESNPTPDADAFDFGDTTDPDSDPLETETNPSEATGNDASPDTEPVTPDVEEKEAE